MTSEERRRKESIRRRNAYRVKHGIPLDAPVAKCAARYATREEAREAELRVKREISRRRRQQEKEARRPLVEAREQERAAKRKKEAEAKAAREARREELKRERALSELRRKAERMACQTIGSQKVIDSSTQVHTQSGSKTMRKRGRILAMAGWLGW